MLLTWKGVEPVLLKAADCGLLVVLISCEEKERLLGEIVAAEVLAIS